MNITEISYVVTVANERSFTKAANLLYVSQSAISQAVSHLEAELNVQLFLRNTKTVTPTPACLSFVETGTQILSLYKKLQSDMTNYSQLCEGLLRIGTVSFFNKILTFHSHIVQQPELADIRFEIVEDSASVVENLTLKGELDFCFTRMPLRQNLLEYEPLFMEEVLLIVPKDHEICGQFPFDEKAPYPTLDLNVFRDAPFIMITNPRIMPICINLCSEAGFSPNIIYRTGTWEHVRTSVETLGAIGFMSSIHIPRSVASDAVRYFRIRSGRNMLEHVVAYASGSNITPDGRRYINAIRNHIRESYPLLK